ncbi:hypothetical protein [Neolewinella persica]|uniref:hypothetical protein n=1 Tax=Neolewinella persica TaxID=70998 RepID=UPI0003A05931|nr:hypothetical protein [Neolewinella persica]
MKQLIFVFLLCLVSVAAQAQPGNRPNGADRKELREERFAKIKAARQAYITEELELTNKEADAFFPVFWSYDERLKQEGTRNKERDFAPADLTEGEALKILRDHQARRQASLNLSIEAEDAFLKVLPARKIIQLPEVERKFRKLLWERTREIRKSRRN